MKIIADTHCHTVASVHAYSTMLENIKIANEKGLWAIAFTDHSGAIPDAPGNWYFENLKILPKKIDGVRVLRGIESNVLGANGEIDLPDLKNPLDWVIASIHDVTWNGKHGLKECTDAWLNVAKNSYVNVIGHSGLDDFKYDYEKVIPIFKENNKLIEINSSSFRVRKGSYKNCLQIAKICKQYNANVVVSSDAHISDYVGRFDEAIDLLKFIDFPEELVINSSVDKFENYLRNNSIFFKS